MANQNMVDVSGSFDIEANLQSSKKEEPQKEDSQLGSGKQAALTKQHMKKSPSVQELEFTDKKGSERRSPDRLDSEMEPLESYTDLSH